MGHLKITYNTTDLFDGEVGKFTWTETGAGGISISADPPRAAGQPNPALMGLSEALKSRQAARKEAAPEPVES